MSAESRKMAGSRAAVGFAVKSGWAVAVLVSGSGKSPSLADSRRVELSDPAVPAARQPYHEGSGRPAAAAQNSPVY